MSNNGIMSRFRLRRDGNAGRKRFFRVDVTFDQELGKRLRFFRFVSGASLNFIINQSVSDTIERRIKEAENARNEETWERLVAAFDAAEELKDC